MQFNKTDIEACIKWIKQQGHRRIFLLNGDLGSGKTTFVRKFLQNSEVSSPTFSICNIYDENIYHFDLYRIECTTVSLENVGLFNAIEHGQYVFVEWADKLLKEQLILPKDTIKIIFTEASIFIS